MLKAAVSVAGVALFAGLMSTSAFAAPPTADETKYCTHDFREYCASDPVGSEQLTTCMRNHGLELSDDCVRALQAAGALTPAEDAEARAAGE